jgi:hypothetical protein
MAFVVEISTNYGSGEQSAKARNFLIAYSVIL